MDVDPRAVAGPNNRLSWQKGGRPRDSAIAGAKLDVVTSAGWGDQTIDVYRSASGVKVVALPHLGRFKLMGRPVSEAAVVAALG